MTLRIGIGLFTGQVPPGSDRTFAQEYREMLELVRLAEALGFDSAWVSEHHGASDGYLPSLLTMLAGFAAATDRMRLGTGVVLTPLHDPLRLAEDAAVVDQLSGGRLTLGLGIAWRPEEFRMFGVPFSERLARTVDTVEILRRAWTGERFSFDGEVFHYDRVRVTPPPAQEGGPPILLGGYVEAAMRRAGRIGDGHITDAEDVEAVRHAAALMEEGAREAGRDPTAIEVFIRLPVSLGDPPDVARFMARRLLTGYAIVPAYNASLARQGFADEAGEIAGAWAAGQRDRATEAFTDELLDATFLLGDADASKRRIQEFRDAGVTTPVLMPISVAGTMEERAERVSDLVEALAP